MAKVFISYRREDTQHAADRLHGALKLHVNNPRTDIFIDIDNIPFGVDFREHLDERVSQCEVLLAVIGRGWLSARDEEGRRRIDDPKDFVRIEISLALKRGIPVVPVLIDGAPVPGTDQLPDDLKPLSDRNGIPVSRTSFETDVARLVRGLPVRLKGRSPVAAKGPKPEGISRGPLLAAVAAMLLIGAGAGLYASGVLTGGAREVAEPEVTLAEAAEPVPTPEDVAEVIPAAAEVAAEPGRAPAAPPAADPMGTAAERAAAIRELQTALRTLGHYTEAVDGAAGVGIQGALTAYGREARVSVPAALGSAPLAELSGLAASVTAAAADYSRREAAAWTIARGADTISFYRAYLADFERGPNAGTARTQIAALEAAARPAPAPPTATATTRRAGDVFRDRFTSGSGEGPEMVVLPSGSFTMGSPASETGRYADEGPQRSVRIGYSLAVGKYEVTWSEWEACVADGGCGGYTPETPPGWGKGRHPVIRVNWNDAQSYVEWLSRKTGQRYRLLSEAEWEYAARAGTTTRWSFGEEESRLGSFAWLASNSTSRTQPVGGKAANGFGLHDMHGNVFEWTQDCWNEIYTGAPTDGSAWTTGDCTRRVVRGGSWYSGPQDLRSAFRLRDDSSDRYDINGFRVARTL